MSLLASLDKRRLLLQIGALLTFALIPVWDRFPRDEPPPLGLPNLNVSYYVLLLPMLWTIAAWLLAGVPGLAALWRNRVRRVWALALVGLAAWAVASLSWAFAGAFDADAGQTAALQLCIIVLFVLAVACAGPPPRAVVAVLAAVLLANATITILQAQTQGSIGLKLLGEYEFGPDKLGVGVVQAAGVRWVRPLGLMPHPNMLAGTLLAGLLASAALVLSSRRWVRWLGSGLFALGLWALLLTFSRAAWLGLALGIVLVLPLLRWTLRHRARRIQVALTAGLALIVGAAFAAGFAPFLAARTGAGQESIELRSVADRIVFTDFALRSIRERPVLGVGIGNFPWRTSYYLVDTFYELRGDNVHNVYLLAWAELGIVGLGLLGIALVAGLAAVWLAVRSSSTQPLTRGGMVEQTAPHALDDRTARVALLALVLACLIIGLLDHYPWTILHFQVALWGALVTAAKPVG
jgi:hypothetical protein